MKGDIHEAWNSYRNELYERHMRSGPNARPARIDPSGCGCTDCLTGYSVPMDAASYKDLNRMLLGYVQNATGHEIHEFTLGDPPVIIPRDDA